MTKTLPLAASKTGRRPALLPTALTLPTTLDVFRSITDQGAVLAARDEAPARLRREGDAVNARRPGDLGDHLARGGIHHVHPASCET